ncbi:2-oxoacid:acceptor oxidoreductase subunit alpha [Candidatus Woesearchaeota archaeon]|nr:MAG: 2-oxoacid:acceptor oxidoreductase subunit alpha [Candidatus Woesearchaeota archaeon]
MEKNKFSWKLGGEAGYGIMTTGLIFSKACTRIGLYTYDYIEYPSLIRGGHNAYQVRVEDEDINSPIRPINLLVALNKETVDLHKHELTPNGGIIFDGEQINLSDLGRNDLKLYHVPLLKLEKEIGGLMVMRNSVALGASFGLLNHDWNIVEKTIRDAFGEKGKDIALEDVKAAKAGYDYVKSNYNIFDFPWKMEKISDEKKMVLTGNEAIGLGAIKAGVKFVVIYPMTPISNILTFLAGYDEEYGIIVKEPEDELSGINMAIGASHMGVRAMTATSGGGYCLMTEAIGMAGITETPLVVIEGMRGGPSTGMPTWNEQGDLKFVLNTGHGEFPRIVLAPGDIEQSYYLTRHAFELAEKYQNPVLLITDKNICESKKSLNFFDNTLKNIRYGFASQDELNKGNYLRFKFTDSGVSPRSVPGMPNGLFIATSDEHTEYGLYDEHIDNRIKMMDKRFRKLENCKKEIPLPALEGDADAEITLVSWGSTRGAILDSMKWLRNAGIKVNYLQIIYFSPFPDEAVLAILKKAKKTLIIEATKNGQLADVIREKTGFVFENTLYKYDGRPIYPEEIHDKVRSILKK